MSQAGEQARIGPGRLVLVVGPSGAGKDTLIRAARSALADDPGYLFPRRIVTRPPSDAEDNVATDPETFAQIAAAGGLTVSWQAHGLAYGLPAEIDLAVAEGRTVVCNVSRTVVDGLRARYETVLVVEVTAPPDLLAERLRARGRTVDGDLGQRLRRSDEVPETRPDVRVVNAGPVADACQRFVAALQGERTAS